MKKTTLFTILFLLVFSALFAQNRGELEHKLVAGFHLGASTPVPIPAEVRKVVAWYPQFSPRLGYTLSYGLTEKWAAGSGVMLDYKGMGVIDEVKYMRTSVVMNPGDAPVEGYFVGENKTEVKTSYISVPLYIRYNPGNHFDFRAGGYVAYLFSGQFSGYASNGYLRQNEPTGPKIEITSPAYFDFNDRISIFDCGLSLVADYAFSRKLGVTGELNWGLTDIFKPDFKVMPFVMHNIYAMLGVSYIL